jgi:subtilase family serine protease
MPDFLISDIAGSMVPATSSGPVGMSPSQLRHAYGMDKVSFGSIAGDGTGQTIAIVDAYNDPDIVADFNTFNQTFFPGQPVPTLTIIGEDGSSNLPGTDPAGRGRSWAVETSLDVQWAHVMAPMANILLVEANSASDPDLYAAINTARGYSGVCVVSMSWAGPETFLESSHDSRFTAPPGHVGETFVASSGDTGGVVTYPAASPNVLSVGGTTLRVDSSGNYVSETGWSSSGGGLSAYEPQPSYQKGVVPQSNTQRAVPDVADDADPNTGVAIIDSWDYGASTPWGQIAGTSLTAPLWAGLIAVVDQGRTIDGLGTLDGATQTIPAIYSLPAADFHDITAGNNGYPATTGYDLVTGRGTPIANLLVPDLVGVPAPATGLGATVISSTKLNLAWVDHAFNATGHYVQQSADNANWSTVATLGPSATSYSATGLTPGTYYYFRIMAYNSAGCSPTPGVGQLAPLPGDINVDGLVDVADYNIWAANVGAPDATWTMGDLNDDGLVDVADYNIWAANVGSTASSTVVSANSIGPGLTLQGSSPVDGALTAQPPGVAAALPASGVSRQKTSLAAGSGTGLTPQAAVDVGWAELGAAVLTAEIFASLGPIPAAVVSTRALQPTPPVCAAHRAAGLAVAVADDVDILAHAKALPAVDVSAGADGKPCDFNGDLLVSPLYELSGH